MKRLLWLLFALTIINSALLVTTDLRVYTLYTDAKNNSPSSNSSQLSGIQSSLDDLSNSVGSLKPNSSSMLPKPTDTLTCTGSLNIDLSGSNIGGFSSFSGDTPVDLTCNPL